MKKIVYLLLISLPALVAAQEPEYDHVFFDNSNMSGSLYNTYTEYKSPSYILNVQKKLPVCDKVFFTPKNSLLLQYVSTPDGNWEAGINFPKWRGKDFIQEGTMLDFKLLIKSETPVNELPAVVIAGKDKSKSSRLSIGKYLGAKTNGWYPVRIPLTDFQDITLSSSRDINSIVFCQQATDGKEHTLYIDQIEIVPAKTGTMNATAPAIRAKAYERHVDITWDKNNLNNVKYLKIYRADDGVNFVPVGIQSPFMGRYADFTGQPDKTFKYKVTCVGYAYNETAPSNIAEATTYTMTDEQLLDMVQEASFRYYWEGAEANSGLALENIPGRRNMVASGASGFGIMAIITAVERGFITREEATDKFVKIANFLERTETFHGGYSHFIDGSTGKVEPFFGPKDNGADMVETSFLFHGLLAARQYFDRNSEKESFIRNTITKLWENIEWDWFKSPDGKYLLWHWSPDQEWVINHKLIGWNETMITYLLAIASPTHGVPADMYYTGWASQDKEAQDYRSSWGKTRDGSMYSNGNTYQGVKLDVGVSTGGPLFFLHYSYLGFNPRGIKDKYVSTDYFDNFRNIALINYRYCVENTKRQKGYGPAAWGLTASDGPWGYRAAEAVEHQDNGTIAPTGALASFPFLPEQSMAALKNYYRNYGYFLWGEYGFKDAFNLNENWCASIYMGLNQAPVTVMIENHRTGLLWDLFMKDPDIRRMTKKVFENN